MLTKSEASAPKIIPIPIPTASIIRKKGGPNNVQQHIEKALGDLQIKLQVFPKHRND